MSHDPRCCGSGTCIIDNEGRCWCGQRWDGDKLIGPDAACAVPAPAKALDTSVNQPGEAVPRTPS